ncbi:MAG: exodeoxyribonuclease VII small subunit [Thermoleophilia bacterium]
MNEDGEVFQEAGGSAAVSGGAADAGLTRALEETLSGLTQSIDRMETIVRQLEAGNTDWEESVRLLTEANELALSSSQQLEQAVQDVVYGSEEGGQQLELPQDPPRED